MIESVPFSFEPIAVKDFALGAFAALALRRGRVDAILDELLPNPKE